MAILRAMDGKFYDVPDDQASGFEVPREKVKELLEKSGGPGPQGGPGGGPGPGYGGPPPSAGGQVVVQIFAGGAAQGGPENAPGQGGPGGPGGPGGGEGDVNPYWWWRNFVPSWGNYWPNY
jgi:hypothetical protein